MKHSYYIVYVSKKGYSSCVLNTAIKIDNPESITLMLDFLKEKTNYKDEIVILNWEKLRTIENMWLGLSSFTQTLLRKASNILKR